ncbi:MAG: hypothetical protein FJ137_20590 [Deltaproteobacteria bacterium]|nr:hypothetical protein [Deltaproteobacteria bacterium]
MAPLLAALCTAVTILLAVRAARHVPLLESLVTVSVVVVALIAAADGGGARTHAGASFALIVVAGLLALPLLALLLVLEQHLRLRRAVTTLSSDKDRLEALVARLAAEVAALRATRATPPARAAGENGDETADRDRRRRDGLAD